MMTAMYDGLYVYLCRKESLLKYFEQILTSLCFVRGAKEYTPIQPSSFLLCADQKRGRPLLYEGIRRRGDLVVCLFLVHV